MQHPIRAIQVIDSSNGELFYIITNRFDLTAEEIAQIYRLRWTIETFFKWIKQHLKIKKFFGISFNAVLNQVYSALTLYCLLLLMHILVGTKHNFLKTVRLIAKFCCNTNKIPCGWIRSEAAENSALQDFGFKSSKPLSTSLNLGWTSKSERHNENS